LKISYHLDESNLLLTASGRQNLNDFHHLLLDRKRERYISFKKEKKGDEIESMSHAS
jgi:hypothetical protein